MSFWLSHIFCLGQIWFYLVFIFSEVKNIIIFVPDFRLLSGSLVSWLIFCCYLLQTFFVSVFLLKKFREESRRSLSSRIWGRTRFIRAHTCIVLASSRPSTVFNQSNLHQDFPPLPANSSKTHNQSSTSLLNFYSFMMVFMIIAGVTYFILSFVIYMDDVAAVSVLRHGGTGPVLEHRHGPP